MGLAIIHKRHWHAQVPKMEEMLERAGISINKEEIEKVVKACKSCQMWKRAPPRNKVRTTMVTVVGHTVEFDYLFLNNRNEAQRPVGHLIDEASRFSMVMCLDDKTWELLIQLMCMWIMFLGAMKILRSDQEGCLSSDDAGYWLQRRGIERKLVGKDNIFS